MVLTMQSMFLIVLNLNLMKFSILIVVLTALVKDWCSKSLTIILLVQMIKLMFLIMQSMFLIVLNLNLMKFSILIVVLTALVIDWCSKSLTIILLVKMIKLFFFIFEYWKLPGLFEPEAESQMSLNFLFFLENHQESPRTIKMPKFDQLLSLPSR